MDQGMRATIMGVVFAFGVLLVSGAANAQVSDPMCGNSSWKPSDWITYDRGIYSQCRTNYNDTPRDPIGGRERGSKPVCVLRHSPGQYRWGNELCLLEVRVGGGGGGCGGGSGGVGGTSPGGITAFCQNMPKHAICQQVARRRLY
jgi:hypothetical protein